MSASYTVNIATDSRLLKRGCESLLGICAGLIADGHLNNLEIQFLRTWLIENVEVASSWPGEVLHKRVAQVLADGVIADEERAYLATTLRELIGGSFADDGAVPMGASQLPFNHDAEISMAGSSFCFTGQFLYGTRAACERAVEQRGGTISAIKRSLKFLVVGELASRNWKHTAFGTKIAAAVALQADGCGMQIVSESQWQKGL